MHRLALITSMLLSVFVFTVSAAADDSSPANDPVCFAADVGLSVDARCPGAIAAEAAAEGARASAAAPALLDDFPRSCRLHVEPVFWTASDWLPLARALAADPSPCADYYVSIPPQAADKTLLRGAQDELIRALGPRIHPVAEITLGT